MHRVLNFQKTPLAVAALALSLMGSSSFAQQLPNTPAEQSFIDWRKANDDVAQFKRGHADVLKWEQSNAGQPEPQKAAAKLAWLMSPDAAVKQAWNVRPELRGPLHQLGEGAMESLAQGRWLEVDPQVRRRIGDFDAILDVAAETRKAWFTAAAANATLQKFREIQDAGAAAAELAQRMARVGNWSRMEQAQWQVKLSRFNVQTLKAEIEAKQAEVALLKSTKAWGSYFNVELPALKPNAVGKLITESEFQAQLKLLDRVVIDAEMFKTSANAQQAFTTYLANHQTLQLSSQELELQQYINEETVLRYSGMLMSVWDLLNQSVEVSQSQINQINAHRDFLISDVDLQHLLRGGLPSSLRGSGGESAR